MLCFETDDVISDVDSGKGVESLTLLSPRDAVGTNAVFLIGLQGDGTIYQIDSQGEQVPGSPFITGEGFSASQYDPSTCLLFGASDSLNTFAAIDLQSKETVASWDSGDTHEEGLALRHGKFFYVASDEGDDHSFVSEYAWFSPAPESVCDTGKTPRSGEGPVEGSVESSSKRPSSTSLATVSPIMAWAGLVIMV